MQVIYDIGKKRAKIAKCPLPFKLRKLKIHPMETFLPATCETCSHRETACENEYYKSQYLSCLFHRVKSQVETAFYFYLPASLPATTQNHQHVAGANFHP